MFRPALRLRREEREGQKTRLYCRCNPGFVKSGTVCAPVVADDAALVEILDDMITARKEAAAHALKIMAGWQGALRALQKGENLTAEIESWTRESQIAQREAIVACGEAIISPLADVVLSRLRQGGNVAWSEMQRNDAWTTMFKMTMKRPS